MTKQTITAIVAMAVLTGAAFAGPQPENGRQPGLASVTKMEGDARGVVHRMDMPAGQLHAGAGAAEVERVLSRPSEGLAGDNLTLVYADEPVRTSVTMSGGRVTAIALDLLYIDTAVLPAHARMVKPTMRRAGVLALLGKPDADEKWTESGIAIEQMLYARGESNFSVFIAEGMVVDVKPGAEKPLEIEHVILPATIPDDSVGTDLSIGLNPKQAASLLGPAAWVPITSTFKGQPVLYATYHERDGHRLISITFTGGTLTAFSIWSPDTILDCGDTSLSAERNGAIAPPPS